MEKFVWSYMKCTALDQVGRVVAYNIFILTHAGCEGGAIAEKIHNPQWTLPL